MADLVESVLQKAAEKESKYKSIEVHKDIDLDIDAGNLLAVDPNPLDAKKLREKRDEYLISLARDNTQLLINRIWELPVERVEGTIVAKLPAPKTILPREKPIPKPKPETKWQQYAKLKGIQNKKKARKVWDDEIKDWRPTWGYQSRVNDELNEWVLEVPANADPYEDQFGKAKKAKTERVAKNELQRMRNIARASKLKVPGVGLTPTDTPSKDHLSKALTLAKKSTASVGKFTDSLPKEKPVKNTGKKRKFEPNVGDMSKEKSAQLDILSKMAKAGPTVDVTKAMKQHMLEEEQQRQKANSERPKKAKSIKKSIKRKQGKDTKRGGGGKGKRRGRK